ncbi:MAG TPA: hypothetical protein DEP28_08960 [Bacteroidetes bacterium]|nr:hypothetical protein [Bacteroidota bacterium]HCN38657.1 hypothetical protein [Bacteroidota bacterium]
MKYLFVITLAIVLISGCGKDNATNNENQSQQDTIELEKDEMFGFTLVTEILETEDENLESYLTTQIYPLASNAKKVTMERLSGTVYYLNIINEKDTSQIWIKKFYNPQNEEVFFEKYDKPVN